MAADDYKFIHSVRAKGSTRVIIPNTLLRRIFPATPSEIVLKATDGVPWTVFTYSNGSEVCLGCGWDTFRDLYVYGETDIAEFSYESNNCFKVCVFGDNMIARSVPEVEDHICLRYNEYLPITAFAAEQNIITQLVDSGILVGSFLNLTEPPGIQIKRRRLVQAAEQFNKAMNSIYTPPTQDFLVANNATYRSPSPELSSGWESTTTPSNNSPILIESGANIHDTANFSGSRGFRRPAGSPHCSVEITPSSIQKGFNLPIPFDFAKSQLVRGANKRILHVIGGGDFAVICLMKGRKTHLVSGWREFATAHQLTPGDRCVFQQNIGLPNTWDVSFFWCP